jgi:hypothetical protein
MSNIAAPLSGFIERIEDLHHHPRNPRRGDVELIAESLTLYGQTKPLIVQSGPEMYVVAGNHTLKAARSLGWTEIGALVLPMSDEQALSYLLMDNATSDAAVNDDEGLLEVLRELSAAGKLEGTGYTEDDVEDITAALDMVETTDFAAFAGGYAEDEATTAAGYTKPSEHKAHKPLQLLYLPEDHERIVADLTELGRRWGMSARRDIVRECVRRAVAGAGGTPRSLDPVAAEAAAEAENDAAQDVRTGDAA